MWLGKDFTFIHCTVLLHLQQTTVADITWRFWRGKMWKTMFVFDNTAVSVVGQFIWPCLDASLNPDCAKLVDRDGIWKYLPV